jgi:hypothetical protein
MQIFKYGALALVALSGSFLTAQAGDKVTAQQINQGTSTYLGKTVDLSGKVDRIISPGAFIVSDANGNNPSHRILVLTSNPAQGTEASKQQAGTAGMVVTEGEQLKLSGKVEKFGIQSESESVNRSDTQEVIQTSSTTMPVLVIKPGDMHKAG